MTPYRSEEMSGQAACMVGTSTKRHAGSAHCPFPARMMRRPVLLPWTERTCPAGPGGQPRIGMVSSRGPRMAEDRAAQDKKVTENWKT